MKHMQGIKDKVAYSISYLISCWKCLKEQRVYITLESLSLIALYAVCDHLWCFMSLTASLYWFVAVTTVLSTLLAGEKAVEQGSPRFYFIHSVNLGFLHFSCCFLNMQLSIRRSLVIMGAVLIWGRKALSLPRCSLPQKDKVKNKAW